MSALQTIQDQLDKIYDPEHSQPCAGCVLLAIESAGYHLAHSTPAAATPVLPADLPQELSEGREGYHTAQTANEPATEPRDGERWSIIDGQIVIHRSNRFPPPAPGTHESDLDYEWDDPPLVGGMDARDDEDNYLRGKAWSRANRQEPT